MLVSVVVCTYSDELFEDFVEAVESVLGQTHDPVEVVAVVDGNDTVCSKAEGAFEGRRHVAVHCNDENQGLSASRNTGINHAEGDVVAFMDDDAVADENWVEELVGTYERRDALAVGGKMTALWEDHRPRFLPEEFFWIVGVTHRGFAEDREQPVRNTFGSNISFRRDVLQALGGFETELGRRGEAQLQGEETELAARLRAEFDEPVWYNPDAKVGHKVFGERCRAGWMVRRAFWQGYSKRVMARFLPDSGDQESEFLSTLLLTSIPSRVGALVRRPSVTRVGRLLMLLTLTAAVGLGYLYAICRSSLLRGRST